VKSEEKAYVQYRLGRAKTALREAKLLLDAGGLHTAVNRLYYACFDCVSALLLTEGRSSSKHSGVRAFFDRDFVNTGRIPVPLGRFYRRIEARRKKADYGDLVTFRAEEVARWLGVAEEFVGALSTLLEEAIQ
jgi:uncharacterized protein (UPF0332 family)